MISAERPQEEGAHHLGPPTAWTTRKGLSVPA